jgi:hypothetical protein
MKSLSRNSTYAKIPAPNINMLKSHIPVIPIKHIHSPHHPGINGDMATIAIRKATLYCLQMISEANAASCKVVLVAHTLLQSALSVKLDAHSSYG